jgi:hypothetical protein
MFQNKRGRKDKHILKSIDIGSRDKSVSLLPHLKYVDLYILDHEFIIIIY